MHQIRQSILQDLPEIGACHAACFPEALTVKLGKGCVEKSLEWFITRDNCFLFHAVHENCITGYCGGFIPRFPGDGSASGMLRYSAGKAILALLMRPWLLLHKEVVHMLPLVTRNLKTKLIPANYPQTQQQGINHPVKPSVGLVVIGVDPAYRGTGVFEMLMQQFEREAAARNSSDLYLSVKPGNTRAIQAYRKAGWTIQRQSAQSVEMIKHIR